MNNIILADGEKYCGNYVATRSFSDRQVINYGKDLVRVHNDAQKSGVPLPVVFYVPEKNMVHIY